MLVKQISEIKVVESKGIVLILVGAFSFLLPFFVSGPQILLGSLVNGLIIYCAFNYSFSSCFSVLMFSSLGALSRGVLFGQSTYFLFYFAPFIWVGNYLLFKVVGEVKLNYWMRVLLASSVKAGFLYITAMVFFKMGVVPKMFLESMGFSQFMTAGLGGIGCYLFFKKNG